MEEIKVNMENLSEEERKQLLSLVAKANDKDKKQKMIDHTKPFYIIRGDGVIDYFPNSCLQANSYLQFGNYFKTKEDAEFTREKHLVSTQLREYAEKHDTKKAGKPFVITLDNYQGNLEIKAVFSNLGNDVIRFASIKVAEDAIKHIGAERLIKYYFKEK